MTKPKAFTLIELLVVISILGFLAGFALVDYGNAIKKSRLEVSVERLISVLEDVHLRAQNRATTPTQPPTQAEDGMQNAPLLSCWGIRLQTEQEPLIVNAPWDGALQECDFSHLQTQQSVKWNQDVALAKVILHFDSSSDIPEEVAEEPVWIFFTPPLGESLIYKGSDSTLAQVSSIQDVEIVLSYGGSEEKIWTKALRFSPATFKVVVGFHSSCCTL